MEKSPSWSRAHDWKSCRPLKGLEGSNPSFSARDNHIFGCGYFFAMCDTIRRLKHVLTLPSPGGRRTGCPKYIGRPPDQPKAALGLEIPESGAGHRPANPEKKDTLFSVSFFLEGTVKIDIS